MSLICEISFQSQYIRKKRSLVCAHKKNGTPLFTAVYPFHPRPNDFYDLYTVYIGY
jgi:hypothetical protein